MDYHEQDHTPIKAVQFVYPDEETPSVVDDSKIRGLLDFIVYYVMTSKSPRLTLAALGYNAGYDVGSIFNTNNSVRSLAKQLGVSHVTFQTELKKIQNDIQLKPRINNGNKQTADKVYHITQSIFIQTSYSTSSVQYQRVA